MGRSLNDNEITILKKLFGEVVFCTVVRVYKSNGNSWKQEGMGAGVLVNEKDYYSIQVVDLNNQSIIFSQELYQNFEYVQPRPFFHTFETENCVAGLSFADEGEANQFFDKVMDCKKSSSSSDSRGTIPAGSSPRPPPPRASEKPPNSSPNVVASSPPTPPQPPAPTLSTTSSTTSFTTSSTTSSSGNKSTHKKKKTFLEFLGVQESDKDDLKISEPRNFRHVSNIGWNPSQGAFEINNIPPEWKKLFQGIGIKKSDLKDKETAAYIMNVIEEHTPESFSKEMETGAPPAPPPPPPPAPPAPPGIGRPSAPTAPPLPITPTYNNQSSTTDSRNNLFAEITSGNKTLKKTENDPASKPPPPPSGLAGTLARAMEERRKIMKEDVPEDENDDWNDEDWEDN
jgi:hypothetical protein